MSDETIKCDDGIGATNDAVPVEPQANLTTEKSPEVGKETVSPKGEQEASSENNDDALETGRETKLETGESMKKIQEAVTLPLEIIEITKTMSGNLQSLSKEMAELRKSFDGKLKYDAKKDEIIDRQHKELEAFKSGLVEKVMLQIVTDLIFEIDSTDKLHTHYQAAGFSEENYQKMLKIFGNFSLSLCNILEKNGIMSYRSEADSTFNPKRQRVLKTTETGDATQDKIVKASLRFGFENATKIIRPEMVEVYVFKPSAAPVQEQATPAETTSPQPQVTAETITTEQESK